METVFSFILRYKSFEDESLEEVARKSFKVLVGSEFVSGLFGTIITVVLAGLWTMLVNIVTTILFIPLLISIIGIILRLTSIVGFWYTWNISNKKVHLGIGLIMALSGFMIPAGFRYIFALIDNPVGVDSLNPVSGNIWIALANPIYPPLLLHTWVGAVSMGFLTLASGFALIQHKDTVYQYWMRKLVLYGSLLVVFQVFIGVWLAYTLNIHAPYMATNIFGEFLGQGSGYMVSRFTFIVMLISGILIIIIGLGYSKLNIGSVTGVYFLGPLAVLSLIAGEVSHDISRYPYMIITDGSGIPMEAFINKLMPIDPTILLIGLIPILVFFIIFLVVIIKIFIK